MSELVDVGAILAAGEPDENGNVIPPGVDFGGYRVQKVGPRLDKTVTVEGLVVDRQTKSFLAYHNTGCCYTSVRFAPFSITGTVGSTAPVWIHATSDCTFIEVDVSASGTYSSGNTSVATVNSLGVVTLKAPGSATIFSNLAYCRSEDFCFDCTFQTCSPAFASDSTPVTVKPFVALVSNMDFVFFGGDPTVKAVNNQMVRVDPSGGSFAWSDSPSNRISTFENLGDLGAGTFKFRLTGATASSSVRDTTITVSYTKNGASGIASRLITSRLFIALQQSFFFVTSPPTQPFGYQAQVKYEVLTHPGRQVVEPGFQGINVHENVRTISVAGIPPEVVGDPVMGAGGLDANSEIVDFIGLEDDFPLPEETMVVLRQDLAVGGIFVRQNELTLLKDRAVITINCEPGVGTCLP